VVSIPMVSRTAVITSTMEIGTVVWIITLLVVSTVRVSGT
jgi:hypothetical protein